LQANERVNAGQDRRGFVPSMPPESAASPTGDLGMRRCCAPVWSAAGDVSEDELYRLIAWVLNELEPAPGGDIVGDVYTRHGGRPATSAELEQFEHRYGPSLPSDGEG
jgi:hypothetical protein